MHIFFWIIALDKRLGVRTVGNGKTPHYTLSKLVLRAVGDENKITCSNLQLCAGLEYVIEEDTLVIRNM